MTHPHGPRLARRLGTGDAVVLGLGSMLGAGVFSPPSRRRPSRPGRGCSRERAVAAAVVVVLGAVNYRGVTRTAGLTRVLVTVVLLALAVAVAAALLGGTADVDRLGLGGAATDAYGVLQSAGLLFFAFAGYARIATLGEEIRDPGRAIPRAITAALGVAVVVYAVVAVTLLLVLGPTGTAAAGALLALLAGVGRTTLAMARNGDLPVWLAAVHPRFSVPHRAELVLTAAVAVLLLGAGYRLTSRGRPSPPTRAG